MRRFVLLLIGSSNAAAQRRVSIRAEDGGAVTGAYYEPSRRPAPGIVLLHMQGRSHADWDAAASELADAGFAVLALDFRSGQDSSSLLSDVRAAKAFLRERPETYPSEDRHCRCFHWRECRTARCGRRSRRVVGGAVVPGHRLQRIAHGSGHEKIRREAGSACRQHEGSVCVAVDPAPQHDRARSERSSADGRGCSRHRPVVARSGIDGRAGGLVQTHTVMIAVRHEA